MKSDARAAHGRSADRRRQSRTRHAVRALVVTPDRQILMIRFVTPTRVVWITPGGGLHQGEPARDGLRRELEEETGRRRWRLGPEVWTRTARFELDGERVIQHERYFWVPSARFKPPRTMPDATERRWFGGFRWWHCDEISVSTDLFAPRELGRRLADLMDGGPPDAPFDVGR